MNEPYRVETYNPLALQLGLNQMHGEGYEPIHFYSADTGTHRQIGVVFRRRDYDTTRIGSIEVCDKDESGWKIKPL